MSTHVHSAGDVLIDRYKVIKYLDEGGMQQVYLAQDTSFGRKVALKVPKTLSAEKRFARSARVSAKVVHANVAATLDYFEFKGNSYLIEEFIDGQTLSERLESEFLLFDPHLAAHVFHHLAKGVAASHHAGVFHRDLKPGNIMVSRDPGLSRVKITDFGIAKMAEDEIAEAFKDKESTTGSQTVMGALPYMAPEMFEDQKSAPANLPADIWALGALLYRLISGELPFGSGLKAVKAILEAKLRPNRPYLPQSTSSELLPNTFGRLWQRAFRRIPPNDPPQIESSKRPRSCATQMLRGRLVRSRASVAGVAAGGGLLTLTMVAQCFFTGIAFMGARSAWVRG